MTANSPFLSPAVLSFAFTLGLVTTGCGVMTPRNVNAGDTNSATSVMGRVIDAQTGSAIAGSVAVALEQRALNGGHYYHIVQMTAADTQGSFAFSNVSSGGQFAILVQAMTAQGVFYRPAILASGGSQSEFGPGGSDIAAGVNVNTISLRRAGTTPANSADHVTGVVTSASISGADPVKVAIMYVVGAANVLFEVPTPTGIMTVTTQVDDSSCGGSSGLLAACASFALAIMPSNGPANPDFGIFNPGGNQMDQSNLGFRPYILESAFTLRGGQPTCSPSSQISFLNASISEGNWIADKADFNGCQ